MAKEGERFVSRSWELPKPVKPLQQAGDGMVAIAAAEAGTPPAIGPASRALGLFIDARGLYGIRAPRHPGRLRLAAWFRKGEGAGAFGGLPNPLPDDVFDALPHDALMEVEQRMFEAIARAHAVHANTIHVDAAGAPEGDSATVRLVKEILGDDIGVFTDEAGGPDAAAWARLIDDTVSLLPSPPPEETP